MADSLFPILGSEVAPMIGRGTIMDRLWRDLTKTTPSNLSIIGPRYSGKTVVMNELACRAKKGGSPYRFVLPWHLGHVAPTTDQQFIEALCEKVQQLLRESREGNEANIDYLEEKTFANLAEVMTGLDGCGSRILMLWDGLDKPLGQGRLTGQLWDQLRTLFYDHGHKLVTATRSTLRQLIRREDSISSPFWNIFDMSAVRLGPFDESDIAAIIASMKHYEFDAGALTELVNWSGCCPPLYLSILNSIMTNIAHGRVSGENVNAAAEMAIASVEPILATLWDDCETGAKDLFMALCVQGEMAVADTRKDERLPLCEKGVAQECGSKLKVSCRFLQRHVQGYQAEAGGMVHLFGTWAAYRSNIRSLLERRLAHISRIDERLCRYVELAIRHLPADPEPALNNLTSIEERALDIIWKKEFGDTKNVPEEIVKYWTVPPRSSDKLIREMMDRDQWGVPADRFQQLRLLQILTGSVREFDSKAKHTSKDSYVLINAIHSYRNMSQHADGEEMHLGVAVAAMMTCVELLACLERDAPS